MRTTLATLAVFAAVSPGLAAGPRDSFRKLPPPNPLALLDAGSLDALSGSLRGYLVRSMPPTLYEASPNWGHTKRVARGVKWTGKRLPLKPELMYGDKEDGVWQRVRVVADNPADTLVFDLRDARQPEPGRLTFTAFVSFDTKVYYDRQRWESGVRLWAGSVRAKLRVRLALHCEATAKLEPNGKLLPDAVFRLRVLKSSLGYDNLVIEHIPGLGGEAAKVFGDAAKGSIKQWHPSLERDLLARADAALVKAGDTKEVRVSLSKLLARAGK